MAAGNHRQDNSSAGRAAPGDGPAPGAEAGVHISHERPAADTEPHIIAPLIVMLADGRRLTARQWSLRGIRDRVLEGQNLDGARLEIPFQGFQIGFPVRLEPTAEGAIWAFEGLTGRQREALGVFYRNLLTGRMAATDEVITALDTPVDLVPMGETTEEKAAAAAKTRPRPLRALFNVAWYVGLFCAVAGFLGTVAWQHVEGVGLSHARIAAERIELRAPREGYLLHQVTEGNLLPIGTVLARIEQPEGEETLAEVDRRHALLERRLAEAQARLAAHLSVRDDVRAMVMRLYAPTAMRRFDAGVPLRPGDYNDRRAQLEGQLRQAETDLDRTTADLRRLRQMQRYMNLTAPVAGFVAVWQVRDGQYVRVTDVVAVLEPDAPRLVQGWLDDRLAGTVRIGMEARIRLHSGGAALEIRGRIVAIEAGADPAAPDRFGMIVTVGAEDLSAADTRAVLPFNSPAEVLIRRGLLGRWLGWGG